MACRAWKRRIWILFLLKFLLYFTFLSDRVSLLTFFSQSSFGHWFVAVVLWLSSDSTTLLRSFHEIKSMYNNLSMLPRWPVQFIILCLRFISYWICFSRFSSSIKAPWWWVKPINASATYAIRKIFILLHCWHRFWRFEMARDDVTCHLLKIKWKASFQLSSELIINGIPINFSLTALSVWIEDDYEIKDNCCAANVSWQFKYLAARDAAK